MNLKEKLRSGDFCVGPFLKAASPEIVEVSGYAGLDFVLLDMEHGPLSYEAIEHLILAAEHVGVAPIVRIEAITESAVIRPLDKGAAGILVPHVDTGAMAKDVVRFSHFSPLGERGMDMYSRAARYGCLQKMEYMRSSNDNTLFVLQMEGSEGLRNLGEILAVPGFDGVFVGPYDLSQSMGMPGEIDHPKVVQAIEEIVTTVRRSGRFVGIYADTIEAAKKWIGLGVQFIALSVDTAIYYQGCARLVAALRG